MHNTTDVKSLSFVKEKRPRRRQSWTEGREGDRKARAWVLQAVAGEKEEAQGRSASQVQEIPLKNLTNKQRALVV